FPHAFGSFHSLFASSSYIIGRNVSSWKVPSTTLQAYSYMSSKMVFLCVPAVVIITSNGCSREDCDCFMTSYKLRSEMECSSSITVKWLFNTSRLLEFLHNACHLDKKKSK